MTGMTLDNQQQKLRVLQPGPALSGSIRSHSDWSQFLHPPSPGLAPAQCQEQYFMFSKFVPEYLSLSLSFTQTGLGPILNKRWWDEIVVCKYLLASQADNCEEETDQTAPTWPELPAAGGGAGGHRLVFSNLFLSRYSSGFCLHSHLLQ